MKFATSYLQGLIFSGYGGSYASPWPEKNLAKFNDLISHSWKEARSIFKKHNSSTDDIDDVPTEGEARRVKVLWLHGIPIY